MQNLLGSADTWFLESYGHTVNGELVIRLVEGFKGRERKRVVIGEQDMGEHFPVTIEPHSRCVDVRFREVRALFTFAESYDTAALGLSVRSGDFVLDTEDSGFRAFLAHTTTAVDARWPEFSEWYVWTEDQLFQVVSGEPPAIVLAERQPDLSIPRGDTWTAR